MTTADATIDTLKVAIAALAALIPGGAILSPALLAAIAAGAKLIADHASGKVNAATMMESISSLATAIAADNTAADAALDAKFKGGS